MDQLLTVQEYSVLTSCIKDLILAQLIESWPTSLQRVPKLSNSTDTSTLSQSDAGPEVNNLTQVHPYIQHGRTRKLFLFCRQMSAKYTCALKGKTEFQRRDHRSLDQRPSCKKIRGPILKFGNALRHII